MDCQLLKENDNGNGFNPEVPIKVFLKLQNIDRRKRNCSTEVNDRRKGKYCEKGSPGKSTESHTITFKCHL